MGWSWVYSACVARQKFSMLGDGQVRAYPGIIWDLLPGCLSSCPFPPSSYIRSFSDWFKVFTIIVTEEEAVSSVFTACEIHESGPYQTTSHSWQLKTSQNRRLRWFGDNSKNKKPSICAECFKERGFCWTRILMKIGRNGEAPTRNAKNMSNMAANSTCQKRVWLGIHLQQQAPPQCHSCWNEARQIFPAHLP